MNSTNHSEACLEKLFRQQEKRPTAEEVLLGRGSLGYTWYRLRLFSASKGIGILLHFAELFLFFNKLHQDAFIQLALLRLFIGLLEAGWWGFLEGLRGTVRRDLELFRLTRIQKRINHWYTLATIATILILLTATTLSVLGSLFNIGERGEFFWIYLFCLLFRLAGSIFSRTVHSAVYGYSRVFRPLWSIVAGDVVWLVSLLVFWPFCDLWAIIYATILSALTSLGLNIHYCRPLYDRLHIEFPQANLHNLRNKLGPRWADLVSSLASVAMRIGSLLIMGYFSIAAAEDPFNDEGRGMVGFFMYLFFIMTIPLLDVAISWANLFYFDLKKYEHPLYQAVFPRFTRFMNFISYELGLAAWIIALFVGTLFLQEDMTYMVIGSGIFFIFRSRLGSAQMRAFCTRRYWLLICSSLILGLAMFLLGRSQLFLLPRDLAFGTILILSTVLLELGIRFLPAAPIINRELSYSKWLQVLKKALEVHKKEPRQITVIDFKNDYESSELALQQLAEAMPSGAAITMLGANRALYFSATKNQSFPWTKERLYSITGGGLAKLWHCQISAPPKRTGATWPWLSKGVSHINSVPQFHDYLKTFYPDSQVVDLSTKNNPVLDKLPAAVRHSLLKNGYRFAMFGEPVKIENYQILSLCKNGVISFIYILPRTQKGIKRITCHLRHLTSKF